MLYLIRALYAVSCIVALPLMSLLITVEVIARYVFSTPIKWAFEANSLLLLLVVFGCLPLSVYRNEHIKMEFMHGILKGRALTAAHLLAAIVGVVVVGILGYQSASEIPSMIRYQEKGHDLPVPHWPFVAFMAVSAAITLLLFLRQIAAAVRGNSKEDAAP